MNKIIWLTGPSKAGKTTLAKALVEEFPCINLDGDEMRESISLGAGFSREDRREHNLRVARLAKVLSAQTTVVVSVIAPMIEVRKEITKICQPIWIHLKRRSLPDDRVGHFYEESSSYPVVFDVDRITVPEEVKTVRMVAGLNPPHVRASVFPGRWQPLHPSHVALIRSELDAGKRVVVALRDTPYSETDPFTVGQRKEMIRKEFGDDVEVVVIPDVQDFCHGRRVGWNVKAISLGLEMEAISATAIREKNHEE